MRRGVASVRRQSIRDDAEHDQDREQHEGGQLRVLPGVQQEQSGGFNITEPVLGWAVLVVGPVGPPGDQRIEECPEPAHT